jgi:glycosyltransferase involved in cell wall biosynthesis
VEEPWATWVGPPTLRTEEHEAVTRVWLDVPGESQWSVPFSDERAAGYADLLRELLPPTPGRIAWLYTPMALTHARALEPATLVYDVMDDLAAFAKAPPEMQALHEQALAAADHVFAGGRSLHAGVAPHRPDAHLFPSGVDPADYAAARAGRRDGTRRVAGYVGVVDERLDLGLIRGLAERLPEWEIRLVGPAVAKIDLDTLPRAPNIVYTGLQPYERLPSLMGEFDVALMPFALNEATRSISPTKTLEYLAAGLPVVSTRVPDVVADYSTVVHLADDAEGFAEACGRALEEDAGEREARSRPFLERNHWDAIAARMLEIVTCGGRR